MSNFIIDAKDMRSAYLKCCADERDNLIFNLENRKLYRVDESGGIFYLKTIDNSMEDTPRKLWHRLESSFQPTEMMKKGRLADELLTIPGNCLCGSPKDLYYKLLPEKDEGNFEFYLWKTSDDWNGWGTHSHFVPLKDYNVSSEEQATMMEPESLFPQEEWVSKYHMDLYRFNNDSRIPRDGWLNTHSDMEVDSEPTSYNPNADIWSMVMNDYDSPISTPRTPTRDEQENPTVRRELFPEEHDVENPESMDEDDNSSQASDWSGDYQSDSDFTDVGESEGDEILEEGEIGGDNEGGGNVSGEESDDSEWLPEEGGDDQSSVMSDEGNHTIYECHYEPEYRYDEWSQDWYTKEEFYEYYGNHSIWKMMHPKKVYRRSIMMITADRIHHWDSKNFKTFMKMVGDSY
jgi:hypothetical protein